MIEVTTLRLKADADEAAFVEADKAMQAGFHYHQPGIIRRTSARTDDGEWVEIVLWGSEQQADTARDAAANDALVTAYAAHVDHDSVRVARYRDLDELGLV